MTKTKSALRNTIFLVALQLLLTSNHSLRNPPSPLCPPTFLPTAERYSFLMMGNLAGQQAVWTASDGTLHIFFQFNDRGRGPKTTSVLKLDPNGIPISEVITGNDYLKSPVNENYSLEAGTARWKNDDEQGEKKISAPRLLLLSQRRTLRDCSARPRRSRKMDGENRAAPRRRGSRPAHD